MIISSEQILQKEWQRFPEVAHSRSNIMRRIIDGQSTLAGRTDRYRASHSDIARAGIDRTEFHSRVRALWR